ncbi:arginine--tRNA ligase [Pseudomonadota bacterium]
MKQHIRQLIAESVQQLVSKGDLPTGLTIEPTIERARQKQHGDFACNIALVLAKHAKTNPRELAQKIIANLPPSDKLKSVDIAGPGFINIFLNLSTIQQTIPIILAQAGSYGFSRVGEGTKILLEYVSANPTGPLHVGHGRGAAYGDALARVLRAAGYETHTEYYVNDAGRQMDILVLSVWLRYLMLCGLQLEFPANAYQGEYITDIAAQLRQLEGDKLRVEVTDVFTNLTDSDPEQRLDQLVSRCKALLKPEKYLLAFNLTLETMVDQIRNELAEFRVEYDNWFSEKDLLSSDAISKCTDKLKESNHLYQKEGAWWFRSTKYGDEKDRVAIRANGAHTYFAADIAYHLNKAERGYDQLINIWGADHHGYIPRVKAAFQALGGNSDSLEILLVQFAILYRGGKKVSMSTRSGQFVTLTELCDEVGTDAARFFYVLRKPEQHMDFDLDLAKSQSNDNPVYYVQYAHARIHSVFRQLNEKNLSMPTADSVDYTLLHEEHELQLINCLARYPEIVESAAKTHEPHQIAYYLRELANYFHTYYNAHPFIAAETGIREARLILIDATRQVIANGLGLLGVSTPEYM